MEGSGPKWWDMCSGTCCHLSVCVSHVTLVQGTRQQACCWWKEHPHACSFTDRNDLPGACPASFTLRWKHGSQQGAFSSVYKHVRVSPQGKKDDWRRADGGHTGQCPTASKCLVQLVTSAKASGETLACWEFLTCLILDFRRLCRELFGLGQPG